MRVLMRLRMLLPDIADAHTPPHSHPHAYTNPYTNPHPHTYSYPYTAALMPLWHLVHRRPRMHTIRRVVSIDMPVRMLLPATTSYPYSHPNPHAYFHPYPVAYAVVYWVARLRRYS